MSKPTMIGGQAVIEGVMMRNDEKYATAVRKTNKQIALDKREYKSFTKRYKILGLPIVRGSVVFIESMVMGMQILSYSAEFFDLEEEDKEPSRFEKFLDEKLGDHLTKVVMALSVVLAMALSIGLFFILPAMISQWIEPLLPAGGRWLNLTDGILRLIILFLYILLISKMKDIQRVFEYHGAEHKTINCHESGDDLTVENVMKHSRFHKRCGTNFIFIVVMVSIIVLMLIGGESLIERIGIRLITLPLIAGISYELLRGFGKFDNALVDIFSAPGMAMQKITTSEPDAEQVEVAITSFMAVYKEDEWSVGQEDPDDEDS